MEVVILAALLPEARAIARAFHMPERFSGRRTSAGNITLCLIGPAGGYLSPERIPGNGSQAFIMAGLAGGLAPDLRIGEVVIQGACPLLTNLAHGVRSGRLASSRCIVATPAEKAALFRQTGALAVDMETQLAAEFAASRRAPFLAVRAISDGANDTLDPALLTFIDAQGRPKVSRAVGHLALHPAKLPALLRIRQASNLALANLASTLVAIMNSGWPDSVVKL